MHDTTVVNRYCNSYLWHHALSDHTNEGPAGLALSPRARYNFMVKNGYYGPKVSHMNVFFDSVCFIAIASP